MKKITRDPEKMARLHVELGKPKDGWGSEEKEREIANLYDMMKGYDSHVYNAAAELRLPLEDLKTITIGEFREMRHWCYEQSEKNPEFGKHRPLTAIVRKYKTIKGLYNEEAAESEAESEDTVIIPAEFQRDEEESGASEDSTYFIRSAETPSVTPSPNESESVRLEKKGLIAAVDDGSSLKRSGTIGKYR